MEIRKRRVVNVKGDVTGSEGEIMHFKGKTQDLERKIRDFSDKMRGFKGKMIGFKRKMMGSKGKTCFLRRISRNLMVFGHVSATMIDHCQNHHFSLIWQHGSIHRKNIGSRLI
jgi:hypothetical protein